LTVKQNRIGNYINFTNRFYIQHLNQTFDQYYRISWHVWGSCEAEFMKKRGTTNECIDKHDLAICLILTNCHFYKHKMIDIKTMTSKVKCFHISAFIFDASLFKICPFKMYRRPWKI